MAGLSCPFEREFHPKLSFQLRTLFPNRRGLCSRWLSERLHRHWFWTYLAAMAGAAGDRRARSFDLGDVVTVDLLDHLVHDARGTLHSLGIVCEIEARAPVRPKMIMIFGVAGIAPNTKRVCPLLHDVVNLLTGEVPGQYLQVGGHRKGAGRGRWRGFRATLRALWKLSPRTCQEEARRQQCDREGRSRF